MRKRSILFSILGILVITLTLGWSLMSREVYGTHGHHGDGDGDGHHGGGGIFDKTPCCVCLNPDCCLNLPSDSCDENGFAEDPVLEAFLGILGLDEGGICEICSACADNLFNDDEDSQFLDLCDLCVLDGGIQELVCTPTDGGGGNGSGGEGEGDLSNQGSGCSLRRR
ncbi:MAG: hypothetical protein R3257_03150 [bacterium]|nr:hypothetical protein [bacterium]